MTVMENPKIQVLWNLCNELRNKRETLLTQWRKERERLQQVQSDLQSEFYQLRHHTGQLENDLVTLEHNLATLLPLPPSGTLDLQTENAQLKQALWAAENRLAEREQELSDAQHYLIQALEGLHNLQRAQQDLTFTVEATAGAAQSLAIRLEEFKAEQDERNAVQDEDPEEGAFEQQRKEVIHILKQRFGKIPRKIHHRLRKVPEAETFIQLLEQAQHCETVEGFLENLEETLIMS